MGLSVFVSLFAFFICDHFLACGICCLGLFFWYNFNMVINTVLCAICMFSVVLMENVFNQLFLIIVWCATIS